MHDIYFKKRFSCPLHASVESLMEDEEDCRINLSNMYHEVDVSKAKPSTPPSEPQRTPSIRKETSSETIDMIDALIKSIEKEVNIEEANNEVPIVSVADENWENFYYCEVELEEIFIYILSSVKLLSPQNYVY